MCVDLFSKGNMKGFSECVAFIFLIRVSRAGLVNCSYLLRTHEGWGIQLPGLFPQDPGAHRVHLRTVSSLEELTCPK